MSSQGKRLFRLRYVLALLPLFILSFFLVNSEWIGAAGIGKAAPGAAIPDLSFRYPPESLGPMFQAMGEGGRAAYLSMNTVDFFFAAVYGLLYIVTLGWLARKLFPARPGLRWIGILGAAGALCDEFENIVCRSLAAGGGDRGLSPVVALASTLKYAFILAAMLLIVAGLLALLVRMVAARGASRKGAA